MTTTGSQASTEVTPLPAERFLGRESSWLAFNERVLELAEDPTIPLLERARFLAIFSSNLDEFFMVRVAGLKRRMATGIAVKSASGQQPRAVLGNILDQTRELVDRQSDCFHHQVVAELLKEGIEIPRWADLTIDEADATTELFRTEIFPVLTPLAVDPAHPFPYISGLSLNLAVVLRNPASETELFARVKVPLLLPRFLPVSPNRFVPLEDVIAAHLHDLFPGMDILQHHSFRVTRNEDVEVEEDDAENLLDALERELTRRRFGPPVRLEVEDTIEPYVLDLLMRELEVTQDEVFSVQGPLDLSGLQAIAALPREDLKFATFLPKTHPMLAEVETSCCTTHMTHSPPAFNAFWSKQLQTPKCWRSSKRCTEPAVTPPSWMHWLKLLKRANKFSLLSKSKRDLMKKPTSHGREHWNKPACMSSMALWD